MTTLKFSDGEEFDLSGSFRKEFRKDGWYVLGEDRLIPVKNEQEADEYIYKHSQPSSLSDKQQKDGKLSSFGKESYYDVERLFGGRVKLSSL